MTARCPILALAAVGLGALGCGGEPVAPPRLEVALSRASDCRPTRIDSARVEAWGDFPLAGEHVFIVSEGGDLFLPALPRATRAFFLELAGDVTVRGLGAMPPPGDEALALVLPVNVSCLLPDPELQHGPGTALAVMEDGTLVLAGGLDEDGDPRSRVVSLAPGAEIGRLAAQPLVIAIAWASATPAGPRTVLVAGGAERAGGSARNNFNRLDLDAEMGARPDTGFLEHARSEHAALRLRSGDVLLVGGRDADVLVPSIERIGPEAAYGQLLGARLRTPRTHATLVERADGSVVIAGGADAAGPVTAIELLDLADDRTTELSLTLPSGGELPPPHAVLPLPGARLLWIGQDGATWLVLLDGEASAVPLGVTLPLGPAAADRAGYVVVHDPSVPRAWVELDPGGRVTRHPSSRAATALAALPDGTFVELDRGGASRFLRAITSEFAPPPASYQFPADRSAMLLDAPARFEDLPTGLRAAEEGASLWVPVLSFRDVAVTVQVSGPATLRLDPDDAAQVIAIDDARVRGPGCEVARGADASVSVRRAGDQLTLDAGAGSASCAAPPAERRVSIGLSLARGSVLGSITLARL